MTADAPVCEPRDGYLRVRFVGDDPTTADFHYFWLRHNCECCRHALTGERTLCSSDVPIDIAPASVSLCPDGTAIDIVWRERGADHHSRFSLAWLRAHAYARDRADIAPPSADVRRLELHAGHVTTLHSACLDRVRQHGAAVVRGAGLDTDALIADFSRAGLRVIETHFGRIEDLRTDNTTNQNTDQLGYTDAPVDLHTDQPYLDEPPRLQMLQCMRPADTGGDNALVDAQQAAAYLASLDAAAYEQLTSFPVRFHRKQKAFERLVVAPIIELRDGAFYRVRSSYFTMAPHQGPFERMEEWYRAYNRFAALVRDPRHQYRARLAAGDFVLYDNFRMLHARTGFSGARWMRGVYFDFN